MKKEKKIELGERVEDTITGTTGTVMSRTTCLHGCDRLAVCLDEARDGNPVDWYSFDAPQLKRTKIPHKTKVKGLKP